MSTYPYPASLVYEKLDLNEVTFRSWRNRVGLYTDSRGEYRWADALRIVSVRLLLDQGLTPEHAVGIVNQHRGVFEMLEKYRGGFLQNWSQGARWSGPYILTGDKLNRAHDKYISSIGDLHKQIADNGLPPTSMLLDLGKVAHRAVTLLGAPPRENADD